MTFCIALCNRFKTSCLFQNPNQSLYIYITPTKQNRLEQWHRWLPVPVEDTDDVVKHNEDEQLSVQQLVNAPFPTQQQVREGPKTGICNPARVCHRHLLLSAAEEHQLTRTLLTLPLRLQVLEVGVAFKKTHTYIQQQKNTESVK